MGEFRGPRGATLRRLPIYITAAALGVTLAVFIVTGIVVGFHRALDTVEEHVTPFGKDEGLTIPLSVLGYLLVPTFIALAVTTVLQLFTARRLITDEEVDERVDQAIKEALANVQIKPQGAVRVDPAKPAKSESAPTSPTGTASAPQDDDDQDPPSSPADGITQVK